MFTLLHDKDDGGASPIPTGDEVPTGDPWDLSLLYASPAEWSAALAHLQETFAGITQFAGHVGESAQALRDCLEAEKLMNLQIERLGHYASLRASEDSSDSENLARESQFENLLTRIGEAT